ncbi:MAG: hypothetical protein JNK05_23235 [Myxococcales bacterium]|nr:hypothetical protein [Myxococcales bacterium]
MTARTPAEHGAHADELERWARETAAHEPTVFARDIAARLGPAHFAVRAKALDGALATLLRGRPLTQEHVEHTLSALRALAAALDADELRATLERLPADTLAHVALVLARYDAALFAVALAAWPGPLPWVSVARPLPSWPGDDAIRQHLMSVLTSEARASSRVRALFELVALGSTPDTVDAIARAAEDSVHDLRTAAVRALGRLGAASALVCVLDSPHATVRSDARQLLEQLARRPDARRADIIESLQRVARDERHSPRDRFESRRALRALGAPVEPQPWSRLHQDAADGLAHEVKTLANRVAINEYVEVLADTDDERAIDAVREALAHKTKVARALAGFRAFFRGPAGTRALHELEHDVDPLVRERAHELARMRG